MTVTLQRQTGAVLVVALFFLVILTLISITAMRASTLGLRMAGNEQEQRRALQSMQSAIVGMLSQAPLQLTATDVIKCYRFNSSSAVPTNCTSTSTLTPGTGYGTTNVLRVKFDTLGTCPRSVGNSVRLTESLYTNGNVGGGNCGYFSIDSMYDDIARRGAAATITVGYIQAL